MEQVNKFENNDKVFPFHMFNKKYYYLTKDEEIEYFNLRKAAIGHWGITAYFFWFIILNSKIRVNSILTNNILRNFYCSIASGICSWITLKYFIQTFNKEYYTKYRKFCLKRGIRDFNLIGFI